MHEHCEHDLKHCGKCDVAYCATCSKEWGANSTYTPIDSVITTSDSPSGYTYTSLACSHGGDG